MPDEDRDLYSNKLHEQIVFSLSTIRKKIEEARNQTNDSLKTNISRYKKISKQIDMQIRVISQMIDSKEAIEIYNATSCYLQDDALRKLANLIANYYEEHKDDLDIDFLVADVYSQVEINFPDDEQLKNALQLIDNCKENYPKYNKQSFEDLIFEINEINPLEKRIKEIADDIRYANSLEQQVSLINEQQTLKKLIKAKKDEHMKKGN